MLTFSGKKLHKDDMKVLRNVAKYTLNKFIVPCVQQKIRVRVNLVDTLMGWSGECYYLGNENGIRTFDITVSVRKYKPNAKKVLTRMSDPMRTLIHELIHVKQYANNQLFDYIDGDTKFEGRVFKRAGDNDYEKYWDSPWEVEAYGRTDGVFAMFCFYNGLKGADK